jgi:hypothetical protein
VANPTFVAVDDAADRVPVPPFTPAIGGGAITLLPADAPMPLRFPRGLPPGADAATLGGGGTTFAGRDDVDAVPPVEPFVFTVGGGGTTSEAPKIFPIRLLNADPLPVCGGGGTTVFDGSGAFPLASRCRSRETSAEGGGATTDGAGKASMGSRRCVRGGAETGGGTTAAFAICTGALEISRLTDDGAGGIMLVAIVGAVRLLSRFTFGAGATTEEFKLGATSV